MTSLPQCREGSSNATDCGAPLKLTSYAQSEAHRCRLLVKLYAADAPAGMGALESRMPPEKEILTRRESGVSALTNIW